MDSDGVWDYTVHIPAEYKKKYYRLLASGLKRGALAQSTREHITNWVEEKWQQQQMKHGRTKQDSNVSNDTSSSIVNLKSNDQEPHEEKSAGPALFSEIKVG